jgi:hypothetical protein
MTTYFASFLTMEGTNSLAVGGALRPPNFSMQPTAFGRG